MDLPSCPACELVPGPRNSWHRASFRSALVSGALCSGYLVEPSDQHVVYIALRHWSILQFFCRCGDGQGDWVR